MDFLEFRRDSRVTMSNSGFHLYWPREVQSSFDLRGRAGDCSLVTAVQNRPHLGLCPGPSFPLHTYPCISMCLYKKYIYVIYITYIYMERERENKVYVAK